MRTGWTRTTKILATVALAAFGALSIGCGPAPGYEQPEPRMPVGYAPAPAEPLTAEELAAQNEARAQAAAQASGEVAVGADTDEYADTDPSALTEFKPALEGHGAWVDDATYGTIWVPSEAEVGTDFTPYTTAGHWTYDDSTSWVWVSDYSWGWAPFHYGRWVRASRHGWAWIPGRTYSGAWVTWRFGPGYDYVGWSPMGPDWYWSNGYAVGWTYGYTPYYSYCHHDHLYSPGISHHVVRGAGAREHEARTQPYTPASPGVSGSGGGRVAASPTVGGGGRVAATPGVGAARAIANPRVGPRPTDLGVKTEAVVAPPSDHAGLAKARVFASPNTAVSQGAAPPGGLRVRPSDTVATAPGRPSYDTRAPITSSVEPAARAPQYRGVNPVPPRQAALPDTRPTPRSFSTVPGYSAPSSPGGPSPSPGFTTQAPQAPSYRSQPSMSASTPVTPTYRAPAPSVASPPSTFRSSPSMAATPSYRGPSPSSTPSFRSSPTPSMRSAPSPSIRSTPAPSMRSAPSVASPSVRSAPAPRISTPSRSTGAAVRSRR